jgi:hypothetical protein
VTDRFTPLSKKDGFKVEYAWIPKEKRLLRFMVLIFRLDKPTTITIKLVKCIYFALVYKKATRWGIIVQKLVNGEAGKIGGTKGCPLTPFLYHLYPQHRCLTDREKVKLEKRPVQPDWNPARKPANTLGREASPDRGNGKQGDKSKPGGQEASRPGEEERG